MKKRLLSLLLVIVMVLSLVPTVVFAEVPGTPAPEGAVACVTDADGNAVGAGDYGDGKWYVADDFSGIGYGTVDEAKAAAAAAIVSESETETGKWTYTGYEGALFESQEAAIAAAKETVTVNKNGESHPGYYKTLQAAINACPDGAETTITMVGNALFGKNKGAEVAKGQNIILDLAGFIIANYEPVQGTAYTIKNNGTLTVTDSSATLNNGCEVLGNNWVNSGTGKIGMYASIEMVDTNPCPGFATNTIENHGTLNFYAGKVINAVTDSAAYACYCVDNQTSGASGGAVFNMYGGYMESTGSGSVAVRMNLNGSKNTNKNIVNMQGGVIGSLWAQTYGKENDFELTFNNATVLYNVGIATAAASATQEVAHSVITVNNSAFGSSFEDRIKHDENNIISISGMKAYSLIMAYPDKVLSDGYFMEIIAKDYINDPYYCVDNPDTEEVDPREGEIYLYKISDEGEEVVPDYEVVVIYPDGTEVNKKYFYEAMDAVGAYEGEGVCTVKLLKDVETGRYYEVKKDLILDLNGKILTSTSEYYLLDYYGNNLTIKNGTIKATGYVYYGNNTEVVLTLDGALLSTSGREKGPLYPYYGKLTIEAVAGSNNTITNTYAAAKTYAIFAYGPVEVVGFGDLEISAPNGTYGYGIYAYDYFSANKGYVLKITNPNVHIKDCYYDAMTFSGSSNNCFGNVIIEGGTYDDIVYVEIDSGTENTVISGGKFNNLWIYNYVGENNGKPIVSITDGYYGGEVYVYDYENSEYVPAITGGTFDVLNNCTRYSLYIDSNGKVFYPVTSADYDYCDEGYTIGMLKQLGYTCTDDGWVSTTYDSSTLYFEKFTFKQAGKPDKVLYTAYLNAGYTDSTQLYKSTNIVETLSMQAQSADYDTLQEWIDDGAYVVYDRAEKVNKQSYSVYYGYFPNDDGVYYPDQKAAGYAIQNNGNGTFTVKPYEVKVEETTVNEETGAITIGATEEDPGREIAVEIKKDGSTSEVLEDKKDAAETISDMLDNSAVGLFVGTGIDDATRETSTTVGDFDISMVLDAIRQEANKGTEGSDKATVTDDDQITISEQNFTDTDVEKKIIIELESAKVAITTDTETQEQQETTTTTTVSGSTFNVTPTAKITVTTTTAGGGTTTETFTAKIPNEAITKPITFRLPVDVNTNALTTAVWHCKVNANGQPIDSEGHVTTEYKQEYLGIFPIQTENGKKFVELSASEFSYFTYENMDQLKESNVVAIRDITGVYVGFDTLEAAITAFNEGAADGDDDTVDNAVAIILLKDLETVNDDFDDKQLELDLNGHKFIGAVTKAENVTVSNKGANQVTLAATGVYANDVKEFVMDGYDAIDSDGTGENDHRKVIKTAEVEYSVVVNAIAEDRDAENGKQTGCKTDEDLTDVYAGDTVTVTVTVNGARFVAADITMQYDPDLFKPTTDLSAQEYTWKWEEANHQYRYTATGGSHYYEDGTVLGTFTFEALAVSEDLVANDTNVGWFKVFDQTGEGDEITYNVRPAYVSDSWYSGFNSNPNAALDEDHAINDYVNVIMKPTMTGSVDGATGLVYNASAQELVKPGTFSAKVNGVNLTNEDKVKIEYAVSKTPVTGDDNIKALFNQADPVNPVDMTGTPKETNAGTYYVYYKISAPGYTSVYGERSVTIAKKQATLTWSMATEGFEQTAVNKFTGTYSDGGFDAPTATFIAQNGNDILDATITLKKIDGADVAESAELKAVGTYEFEATYKDGQGNENYTFVPNSTATVTVKGQPIKGWKLEATTDQYIDGKTHPVASLTLDNTVENFGPAANAAGLEITFRYSKDNGATWTNMGPYTSDGAKNAYEKAVAAIPVESAEGTYKLQMTVKADTYETTTFDVTTFNIKKPVYVVETSEYVSGWTEILVYTNETVTFRYGDDETNMLYDVTAFGYRYQNTMSYSHVYAIVVEGEANLGKIFASNNPAKLLDLPDNCNIHDVNTTGTTNVTLEDAVAAQSVYNVNADYLKNPEKMAIVLRCDVNRDKKVNVAGDVSAILNEYVNNWNS